ncbi:uncharacterized protein EDB91DRAFT_1087880 [Suillus paluster]|uniref:uncharacterized protein n=1 Tax=Suillus paluster TaxID=48578 RepID=UPI001B882E30|nr:uncharacterized protein EDB91DRAFT_1087880 [Suillus paluster]KAG1723255.1 hypothetical protein EDB91DRAFT_1087880 [Suillus paluster]
MTSSGTDSQVPVAPIASPSSGDSLTALFAQLNINGNNTVSLTSALSVVVQNAVIATIQEVAAAAPVVTVAAPTAPPVIDLMVTVASTATNSTPPVTTTPPAIVAAAVTHTRAHRGVIYITPEPNSCRPFLLDQLWASHWCCCDLAVGIHLCDRDISTMYEHFSRLVNHFEINAGCSHWEIEMLEHFKYKLLGRNSSLLV